MSDLLKAIERAGEIDERKSTKEFLSGTDANTYGAFMRGRRTQHAQDQWLRDVARIAVEALKDYRGRLGYKTAAQWQKAIGEDKGQWDNFADKALEQIAALVPKGE
jgi:N-acyl-D-aspartate/D-glutamate deacylase